MRGWNRCCSPDSAGHNAGDLYDHSLGILRRFATLVTADADSAMNWYKNEELVARHHVLGHALQTDDRVRYQRHAPEPVVVLA